MRTDTPAMAPSPVETTNQVMPLSQMPKGARGMIVRLQGGCRMTTRLADLGILPGVILEVLRDGSAGALMLSLRGNRLAIGNGMAERVLVKPWR